MTDTEFEVLAGAVLGQVQRALDASGVDVDVEAKGDGVLELEFQNGSRIIINRHAAAQEIWVAAKSGGFHFRHDGSAWRDTRDAGELFGALSRLVSAQAGTPVMLAAGA